jgi:hypothetical protein
MNATNYELYLKQGPTPGIVYPLTDKGLTIGRDPLSDILINNPEVSRQHALLKRTVTGDYYIQDLGSTNGTYIDGKRLGSDPLILRPSNIITLGGEVTLVFQERSSESYQAADRARLNSYTRQAQQSSEAAPAREIKAVESNDPAKKRHMDNSLGRPSSQPKASQPPVNYTSEEFPSPPQIMTDSANEISPSLILGVVLLFLCSCASILIFLMYLGGDWFFREIGLVP